MKHAPINTATAPTSDLLAALAFSSRAAKAAWRSTTPVLSRVLLAAHGDRLTVAGTDLDIEARATIEAATTGDLSVTLCPRLLTAILRGGDGTVTITSAADRIDIANGDIAATFNNLIAASDWPELIPDDAALTEVAEIGEADLHRALTQVAPCISTEETRYYLNGAFLTVQRGHLRMVSTDGHRMAVYDLPGTKWADSVILPAAAVKLLQSRLRAGGNSTLRVSKQVIERPRHKPKEGEPTTELFTRTMIFDGPDWRIASKLIDGCFPDYTRILPPDDRARDFTLCRAALGRIPDVSRYGVAVKIHPDAGRAEAKIDGSDMTIRLPVTGRGGAIGFNLRYLRAFAAASPSGTIRLTGDAEEGGNAHRVTHDDPAFLGVLMPMRV